MKLLGSFAALGFMWLLVRAAITFDIAWAYGDCQLAIVDMAAAAPTANYEQKKALHRRAETMCRVADVKVQLGQAMLAPATMRE